MLMLNLFEQYKLMKNNVQLLDVSLHEMFCKRENGSNTSLIVNIEHKSGSIYEENKINIYLKVSIGFEETGPFSISCVHEGVVVANNDIDKNDFISYIDDQIVPLLLPYAREFLASTMTRMQVPPYTLPTIDVLKSMAANKIGNVN